MIYIYARLIGTNYRRENDFFARGKTSPEPNFSPDLRLIAVTFQKSFTLGGLNHRDVPPLINELSCRAKETFHILPEHGEICETGQRPSCTARIN